MTLKTVVKALLVLITLGFSVYFARGQHRYIGTSTAERNQKLPGDDLIPNPNSDATRAIAIAAPAQHIWPWIVQLGQNKSGFYTYTFIQNLAGCEMPLHHQVVPQWQNILVGEDVKLAPEMSLKVAQVAPEEYLVLTSQGGNIQPGKGTQFSFSWAFVLVPLSDTQCCLLVRERYLSENATAKFVITLAHLISTLMTSKMLRTIRNLAESFSDQDAIQTN